MLRSHPAHPDSNDATHPHRGAVWIDLNNPTPDEVRLVEQVTGLTVPARVDLEEIETSSRQYREKGTLYLSLSVSRPGPDGVPERSPVGFMLTADQLISIRFADLPAFTALAERWGGRDAAHDTGVAVLADLFAGIVGFLADRLEHVTAELDQISRETFHAVDEKASARRRANDAQRQTLRSIGQSGDVCSHMRDVLLGIGRAIPFVLGNVTEPVPADVRTTLNTVREDVMALASFEEHLTAKVQFLLDASLGFINLDQNNIMKVLTVASVAGIPPVLIAGVYGMNFKIIPEYDWAWGYPYALGLMVVTAAIPLLWFRRRHWL